MYCSQSKANAMDTSVLDKLLLYIGFVTFYVKHLMNISYCFSSTLLYNLLYFMFVAVAKKKLIFFFLHQTLACFLISFVYGQ